MSNKILVTAATGNIGSEIVKILKAKGAEFKAGVTANDKSIDEVETVVVDYNDPEGLKNAFTGFDTVFLLFPMAPKMIEWGQTAVEAAKAAGVKHIVRSSGAGADSTAGFMMPKVQGTIDKAIHESGISYTITQPAAFMQNFSNFMRYDIQKGTVYQPIAADAQLNWVDVRDIAAVNAEILLNPQKYANQTLAISGPENLSYAQTLNVVSEVVGKPVQFVTVPDTAAIEAMQGYQMPPFSIDMMMSLNAIINAGYAAFLTDTVKTVTGHEPIPFRQFVSDYKELFS